MQISSCWGLGKGENGNDCLMDMEFSFGAMECPTQRWWSHNSVNAKNAIELVLKYKGNE